MEKITSHHSGMHCASCTTTITETSKQQVNIETLSARRRLILSWLFTLPIMLWMLLNMLFNTTWPTHFSYKLGMIILAIPVILIAGYPTLKSALRSVLHLSANMDVLIALGALIAYLTSIASLFTPMANYAGIAAMIMAFNLTGKYIEAKAQGRTSQALEKLLALGAKTARILVDHQEKEVELNQVKIGDIMLIRPGEKIPTDGVIVQGKSSIDESLATGESMPITKTIDDKVIGATINQQGLLQVKATKIGQGTFLSQVIKMVEECQSTKVPIQAFADKVTNYFVPAVLIIAALTLLGWLLFPKPLHQMLVYAETWMPWVNPQLSYISLAIVATVAVLVIACPCALGLATPTALMVGTGIGAENGILIRSGSAIQTIKEIHTVVFDKTGTLTTGKLEVTDVINVANHETTEILRLAASTEIGSEHPLGKAIVRAAQNKNITLTPPQQFTAITSKGVKASIDNKEILIGNKKLDPQLNTNVMQQIQRLEDEAKTVILVIVEKQTIGVIGLADTVKKEAKETIAQLSNMGIQTVMLTGDNEQTAQAIAKQAGINKVLAELLPAQKVTAIQKLQKNEGLIAMVGDGINDAPALTQADVGIAIGTGTDIAIEASDITLVRGDLLAVVTAIQLSRAIFRTIKQNLYWAYGYNVLAIPIACLGLLHPLIAEIAMAISSISVITNANLLRRHPFHK
ncbi:MAG: copper-translocating P-type ATPase [Pseudomonadota bacterium]